MHEECTYVQDDKIQIDRYTVLNLCAYELTPDVGQILLLNLVSSEYIMICIFVHFTFNATGHDDTYGTRYTPKIKRRHFFSFLRGFYVGNTKIGDAGQNTARSLIRTRNFRFVFQKKKTTHVRISFQTSEFVIIIFFFY